MTLERRGRGTATFTPQGTANLDILTAAAPPRSERLRAPQFEARFQWLEAERAKGERAFRITITDLREGLFKSRGYFHETHARSRASSVDTSYEGEMTLPMLRETLSSPDLVDAGFVDSGLAFLNFEGKLAIAGGDKPSENQLFIEDTTTDPPTLTTLAYDFKNVAGGPTTHTIRGLAAIQIGTQAARLCVYGSVGPVILNTWDTSPSEAGRLDTGTDIAAVIQSPLPDHPIGVMAHGDMQVTYRANDITDPMTTLYTGFGEGGYGVGIRSMAGGYPRIYWVLPPNGDDLDGELMRPENTELGRLFHTGLNFRDPQPFDFPMPGVKYVMQYREGVIASDKHSVYFYNGAIMRNTRIFADSPADSEIERVVVGFTENGPEAIARVQEIAQDGASRDTVTYELKYDFDLNAWTPASPRLTLTGLEGEQGFRPAQGNGFPISHQSRYRYWHNRQVGGEWSTFYTPEYGRSLYSLRSSDGGTTGRRFASSGQWTSPDWIYPYGFEAKPKIVDRFIIGGEVPDGTSVRIRAGEQDWTFTGPLNNASHERSFPNAQGRHKDLGVVVDLAQTGANTGITPQPLPIIIEGRVFEDERRKRGFIWW